MAAGAIRPPLFFGRRGEELICGLHFCVQHFAQATAISETSETTSSVDHVTRRSARAFAIESERSPR
jgi:hypothetical protein